MIEKFRLKELRKEAKLSQKCLAKQLNVSQSTICKWESGCLSPHLTQLVNIKTFFNVTVDYLIGLSDEKLSTKKYARN